MQEMLTKGTSASGQVNRLENLQKFSAFEGKKVILILAKDSKYFQDGIAKISGLLKGTSMSSETLFILLDEVEYHSRPGRHIMGSLEIGINEGYVSKIKLER